MPVQRWTLAVVCAATAMLMLDIAVVNTALSDIAADLDTGLSGLQWVVDAYTLALAATVLTAGAATIGASFAVGPLVGGALTSGLDWRWIFLVNLPIGLACIAATRAYVQESRDPTARGIDWAGQVTLTGGLFLLVLALLRGNEDGWTSLLILGEAAGAIALLGAFVVIEARSAAPMLPLRLFRDRSFSGAQIAAFAISASFFAPRAPPIHVGLPRHARRAHSGAGDAAGGSR